MKAKKALKKLNKVEVLLSNVMEGFPGNNDGLENLLGAAKVSIEEAIKTVGSSTATGKTRSSARSGKGRNGRLSAEGRRRISRCQETAGGGEAKRGEVGNGPSVNQDGLTRAGSLGGAWAQLRGNLYDASSGGLGLATKHAVSAAATMTMERAMNLGEGEDRKHDQG